VLKVNFYAVLCALVRVFYTKNVKNLFCVAYFVTTIVLECCQPYSGEEIVGQNLIKSRVATRVRSWNLIGC
jgi:hypothetical protein